VADYKALTRRFYEEVFNKGDLQVLDELVDDSLVEHEEFPGITPGKAGLVQFAALMRAAFPDLNFDVLAIVSDGDEVWAHVVMRGTHKGEFLGIPATGRRIEVPTIDRIRVRDDRAVEHWGVTDTFAMMQQLGVIPEGP
jgi:steroid delta-isomerase-like uncharacterized protein